MIDFTGQAAVVTSTEKFIVPASIVDEVLEVCERRGVSPMPDNVEVAFPKPRGS